MTRFAGPLAVLGVGLFAIGFATWNGTERVTLDLGILVLYNVPVTLVAFGGLLTGMLVMLGAGVATDLKVREILRQRLEEETREAPDFVDDAQRDLFFDEAPAVRSRELPRPEAPPTPRPAERPVVSIESLAPEPPSPAPPAPDPVTRSRVLSDPQWRDMEHGDPTV